MVFGLNFSIQKKKLVNEAVSKALNQTVSEIDAKTETNAYSEAIVEFENNGIYSCADGVTITADATSSAQSLANITQNSFDDFSTDFQTNLEAIMEDEIEQSNEGGFLGAIGDLNIGGSIMDSITSKSTDIQNIVENVLKSDIKTEAGSTAIIKIVNNGIFDIEGECIINANALSEGISENIASQISDTVLDNIETVDIAVRAESSITQSNKGIDWIVIVGICVLGGGAIAVAGDVAKDENVQKNVGKAIDSKSPTAAIAAATQSAGKLLKKVFKGGKLTKGGGFPIIMIAKVVLLLLGFGFAGYVIYCIFMCEQTCQDNTKIGPDLIAGGNTEKEQERCEEALNKNPPEILVFKDEGGACDDEELPKHPRQLCNGEEYECAHCPDGSALGVSMPWKWISFWVSVISFILIYLMRLIRI
jgi:hypothetical protein